MKVCSQCFHPVREHSSVKRPKKSNKQGCQHLIPLVSSKVKDNEVYCACLLRRAQVEVVEKDNESYDDFISKQKVVVDD